MADKVLMPKQGNSVESCIIVSWLKKEGDAVSVGDIICEVETDKATIEVESSFEGTMLKTFYEEEDDVPVHNLIALIGEPGEDISMYSVGDDSDGDTSREAPVQEENTVPLQSAERETAPAATVEDPSARDSRMRAGSPRAVNLATAKGIDIRSLEGSGPDGRIIERDVLALTKDYPSLSPAAIEELLKTGKAQPLKGSGIGGRVLLDDVKSSSPAVSPSASALSVKGEFPGPVSEIKVRGIRKITAQHMFNSLSTTAQLTLNTSVDATAMLALRAKFKNSDESLGLQKITINDLILFAVAKILPQFPEMNEHFLGDKIVQFEKIHLGCAVNSDRGLLVPVIKDAGSYSLRELSRIGKELFGAAADGKSNPDDLSGGTFTITNLGSMGIESFTPVLNKPEVGILGVCSINLKPVQIDGEVQFVPHMGLSLTFDHQAVDGAPAAAFLKALVSAIKNIDLLMAM